MVKIFLKTLMISFLWIILFANLVFAFNLTNLIPFGTGGDMSNRYFGVSTLINGIQNLNGSFDFGADWLRNFIINYKTTLDSIFDIKWNDTFSIEINDISAFFEAFGSFFVNVFKSLGLILTYVSILPLWLAYLFTVLLNLVIWVFKLLGGYFFTEMPTSIIL